MKRVFKFITLFFICFYTGYAQESTKKHTVRSGETLLSISALYGISAIDLQNANPEKVSGIKENDVLIIPQKNSATTSSTNTSVSYTVKNGDTKFGLAKRFGLTVSDLEIQNPEILSGLEVGQVLKIFPAVTSSQESAPTAASNSNKKGKYHVVQSGETLFGISNANGLTVDQLVKANSNIISGNLMEGQTIWIPGSDDNTSSSQGSYVVQAGDTKFSLARRFNLSIQELERRNPHTIKMLQVGQILKVPFEETSSPQVSKTESGTITPPVQKIEIKEAETITAAKNTPSQTATETIKETDAVTEVPSGKTQETVGTNPIPSVPTTTVRNTSGYYDLSASASTPEPKNILFFLPFSEQEYHGLMNSKDNFNSISDNFKRSHLEFYRGANIAIDSIRKMNLKVNVNIIEAQSANQTAKVKSAIEQNNINNYDAVILPFYRTIDGAIEKFTTDSKIPVITATTITHKNKANNLYSAAPSVNQQRLEVLNYMKAKQAHIIVLNDINRSESKAFITQHTPNVDFVDIKKNGSFSENELISKFKKDRLNFVVIDSDRNSVFLNATNTLLNQLTNYKLQLAVLEASLIPDDTDVSQKRYRILKMVFPSSIPAKSTGSSKQFLSRYQKKYNLLPSANIMLGFDITFDSLLRLMQQQSFEYSAQNYITEYTQLKFNYKKNSEGGYSNEGLYILQYDSDVNIRDAN